MEKVPKWALERLQKAQRKQLIDLDLSCAWDVPDSQKLTQVPTQAFELKQLKKLDLRRNLLIVLPPEIGQLTNLQELDLGFNQLSQLPLEIAQLTSLRELNLVRNQLSQLPSRIGQLTNLQGLFLGGNRLSQLPLEIGQLTSLQRLDLRGNQLSQLPSEIGQMTCLQMLDLRSNQLSQLPSQIGQLTSLRRLDLGNNILSELPSGIGQLSNLVGLDLGGNRLSQLSLEICELVGLRELHLGRNQLDELPSEIDQLVNLSWLGLDGNQLSQLPTEIIQLVRLEVLRLGHNRLSKLPSDICQLVNLTGLDLDHNQLNKVPAEICQLTNLQELYLGNNQLSQFPVEINQLANLWWLDLSGNQLTELPLEISQLASLKILDLGHNRLRQLPTEVSQLIDLEQLVLDGNPLEQPPLEIAKQGVEAIRGYFRQLESEGANHLYEAKLLIVGEAGAGKTTLAKKIQNPDYQLREEKSTEGIDIILWEFSLPADLPRLQGQPQPNRTFRVNVWDFGGQEIYHATHQFFLTKRSLYALVADSRKEDTDFHYWLNVAELLGGNSPLVIVKNEKRDRHREIDEHQLRGRFDNLKETLATNLATNRGLPQVLNAVKYHICHLPHVGDALPKNWSQVREALESDSRNYISLDEYLEVCERNGFTQHKDKLQLSSYLHDLGVCLHFQDDPLLKRIVILKPEWGTDAVYKVLDNDRVISNLGRFTQADLTGIWHEDKYAAMQAELLQLMINFKLCYRIPGSDDVYIAPQLLTMKRPDYDWDESDNLLLRYTYQFMPKGILTRFIVTMHRYIADQECVWRSGVVLEKDETKAEVVEYYDGREIHIRVAGRYKRDLLTIVAHELDEINDSFHRLKYNKLVPCNCPECQAKLEPHFYPFDRLRKFMADRQPVIQCPESYQMVGVQGLVDDAIGRDAEQRIAGSDSPLDEPRSRLFQALDEYFDGDELKTLCFHLKVDYDGLPGEGKTGKARELVAHLERHGRLRELILAGRITRPDVPWDKYS